MVVDATSILYEQLKSCEIARMEEHFFPFVYAVGLQNNSVYNEVVSLA